VPTLKKKTKAISNKQLNDAAQGLRKTVTRQIQNQ
jgi:hypothetical protein